MLDISYCDGQNCLKSNICQRYADYLYWLKNKQNIKSVHMCSSNEKCEHFDLKRFTGN